ncbi:EscI/YscI/HrpB family type III secretion system inner rod protein [Pectobacterium brasiliense]|uniref:Type III secretion protein n=1 Tax=Pectobacterium brasiliense TaxID=180957 RepID=A0A0M2F1R2_9GAMM|nr:MULTISPECIES: EscI/YscI/HrpB family type III secretion system inner rod protein [Pectobacterium]KGA33929.1 type III secretion protein [Pectobacterium brasiliense]MBN3053920.1 EscI/YscI/HrpB family type III secretion system inner rod protein [Pectobacterium brasiliense]MBN3188962.1 EscI/YscI/HrpB family type III secretion system inner rod protein [Pectobacterium brasiliense]MCA5920010.1 EscI/YscI/HrpB family type III secretion system inner rod protein [Pectobacterium brasiliense]MCA5927029.1
MKINHATTLPQPGDAPLADNGTSFSSATNQDVSWFSAAMSSAPMTAESGNSQWLGALAEKSQGLNGVFKSAERDVSQSMRSNNPKDVLDATRTLSSFYLESLLSAKLVAKSVQSLEKLTNLQ